MSTRANGADVRFLKAVLASLILCTLVSGAVCVKLASADAGAKEIAVAARQ